MELASEHKCRNFFALSERQRRNWPENGTAHEAHMRFGKKGNFYGKRMMMQGIGYEKDANRVSSAFLRTKVGWKLLTWLTF
jgi:hypothetical protein